MELDKTSGQSGRIKAKQKQVMKHCKTLFVLVAATIVMLTSGCARQTVHPVPIRYNFLDHIPDYDPMLMDTESLSTPHSVVPDTARAAAFGATKKSPVPVSYRFRVEAGPDREPQLPGNAPGGELAEPAAKAGSMAKVHYVPPISFQFKPGATPDHDPMLLGTIISPIAERNMAKIKPEPGYRMDQRHPAPVRYFFRLEHIPDYDPMLQITDSVANTGIPRRISTLAATSTSVKSYR